MKVQKWVSTGLSIMMLTTMLIGCSGGDGKPVESNAGEEAADLTFPLAEPVTMKFFAEKSDEVKKDYNDLKYYKDLKKATNVNIEWDLVTGQNKVEKKNLMFASGDLPDVIYGAFTLSDSEIVKYGTEGSLIPLNDLIEKHAPNISQMFKDNPEFKKMATAPDGNIYSIPTVQDRESSAYNTAMVINKKWLDKLGLEVPTTTEELEQVLKAFKEGDPNGNGKQDEIPLSFVYGNHARGPGPIAGSFGIMDDPYHHTYIDNGKMVYAPSQPGYRDYVEYLNKLHQAGLIDEEVFTQNNQVYEAKIKNSEPIIGAFFHFRISSVVLKERVGDYTFVPALKGPKGDQSWYTRFINYSRSGFAITSVNKNPEIAMKWIDQSYTEQQSLNIFYGPEGVNWKETADGKIELLPAPEGMSNNAFTTMDAPSSFGASALLKSTLDKIILDDIGKEVEQVVSLYKPTVKFENRGNLLFAPDDIEQLSIIEPDLNGKNNYIDKITAKFVINGVTQGDWDAHLEQLKKLRAEEMINIYQRNYDATLK
ncbi:extracellular solute-binding protein [Paenibacillus sp. F411]|uniref:extracellular solute-binding protein n=1 Tax=Paenibacillus sp. F411 TaxID=2820239 RepID=UPI001AAE3FDC|nr:extracellular solute-binding protein [Paenibacillus sp. F411]MBO2944386.1 extracellular solute-binding protein [Paenibacillus sp. F411]